MIKQKNNYSLWLRPSQSQIDELTKIISRLAHHNRGVLFPPHITLLTSISASRNTITNICTQIIEQHSAFDITLEEIAYTDMYFRNLYILARLESSLISLYEDSKKRLNHTTNEVFIPHVSLFYGKLDVKKQQALKEELTNNYSKVFSCQRIDLYETTGKESEWHLIKTFYLKKS